MKTRRLIQLTIDNKRQLAEDHARESKRLHIEAEKSKLIAEELSEILEESDPSAELRGPVELFALQMEANLAEHDNDRGERGWIGAGHESLRKRVSDELKEFDDVLHMIETSGMEGRPSMQKLIAMLEKEAGDIANFLMMIVDDLRERKL